jgi:hypothetical protein
MVGVLSFTLGLFTTGLVSPGTFLAGFLIGSTHFLSSEILVKSKKTFFSPEESVTSTWTGVVRVILNWNSSVIATGPA